MSITGTNGPEPQDPARAEEARATELSQRHRVQRVRDDIRRLVLMKETGPKSAAWHCARVRTIWRLQRRLDALDLTETEG